MTAIDISIKNRNCPTSAIMESVELIMPSYHKQLEN